MGLGVGATEEAACLVDAHGQRAFAGQQVFKTELELPQQRAELVIQGRDAGLVLAAKYRFYGRAYPYQYTNNVGDVQFAEAAWIGYKFNPDQQVQMGLNQVRFGLQPYFGSTFYEPLGNVIGVEDLEEIGAKYIQQSGDWNIQTGYYLRPAWQGKGTSSGATYSSVVSEADSYVTDGSNNQERNTLVLRVAKALDLGPWKSKVGISGLTSTLENRDTDDDGRRNAVAVSKHRSG